MTCQTAAIESAPVASTRFEQAYRVAPTTRQEAGALVIKHHYLHRKPHMSHCYGLTLDGETVGVVTFGVPASRHMQMGAYPEHPDQVVELNRLWLHDSQPHGLASWFVARALKLLPPRIVLSYADTTRGHLGYVYRACNFWYAGWTDMERRQARYDYIPLRLGAHTRDAWRSGVAKKVRRKPKVKYWNVTGNRSERKALANACRWPALDWREFPPPDRHQQLVLPPGVGEHDGTLRRGLKAARADEAIA